MSRWAGVMMQAASGLRVDIYDGWSWPAFLFGPLWYLSKGMWGIGLLWLALSVVSLSGLWFLGLLVMPFVANRQHREHLAAKGYHVTRPYTAKLASYMPPAPESLP